MKVNDSSLLSKSLVIPIFIVNSGCPHRCIFCNQQLAAGNYPGLISRDFFDQQVMSYLGWNKDKARRAQIAFYGGSFTGVDPKIQEQLLSWANDYIQRGLADSIRISTRPDLINADILSFLKKHNVRMVEIGAQSFVDDVLQISRRGHKAQDTINAMKLLREWKMQSGLHLMIGLPKDTSDGFGYSLEKTIELRPDTVRIHPVLVFRDTELAQEFQRGQYEPLSLAEAVDMCVFGWKKLTERGIRIIRCGLHWTQEMERKNMAVAGPVHPAFGHLVLSALFGELTGELLRRVPGTAKEITFLLSPQDVSGFRGLKNSNICSIKNFFPQAVIKIETVKSQKRGCFSLRTSEGLTLSAAITGLN